MSCVSEEKNYITQIFLRYSSVSPMRIRTELSDFTSYAVYYFFDLYYDRWSFQSSECSRTFRRSATVRDRSAKLFRLSSERWRPRNQPESALYILRVGIIFFLLPAASTSIFVDRFRLKASSDRYANSTWREKSILFRQLYISANSCIDSQCLRMFFMLHVYTLKTLFGSSYLSPSIFYFFIWESLFVEKKKHLNFMKTCVECSSALKNHIWRKILTTVCVVGS